MARKTAEPFVTNASGLTLAQWIRAASFAQGHGLGPGNFREARRDWEANVDPAEWGRLPSKRHHATKKSPAQLQREIDEVLAKPGAYSYEKAMSALEKKHANVTRGGSLRAGHAPVIPKKEIVGFEFQIESNGRRYWTQLQGSGGKRGAGTLHAVHALDPKSQRVKAVCAQELRAAREELRREGTIRIHQDREDPEQRIRAMAASAIKGCRPIVA